MSVRSGKRKHTVTSVEKLNLGNNASFQTTSENTQSQSFSFINSPNLLVDRLLKLQVELVSKINQLKTQKIHALQAYNHQYDRYSLLTLKISNNPQNLNVDSTDLKEKSQNLQEKDTFSLNQELKVQEKKLKTLLTQIYELKNKNHLQENLLNSNQLQQISYLTKINHFSKSKYVQSKNIYGKIYNENELKLQDSEILKKINEKNSFQSTFERQSSGILLIQEIEAVKQATEKLMSRKLLYLELEKRAISRYQSESSSRVKDLLNKSNFFEKQLEIMNKTMSKLSDIHESSAKKSTFANTMQYSVEKWENIVKYQNLKQKVQHLKKQLQENPQKRTGSKVPQLSKKQRVIPNIEEIKAKIGMYQKFIQEEGKNKNELYSEIKKKKLQYDKFKRENEIMEGILVKAKVK